MCIRDSLSILRRFHANPDGVDLLDFLIMGASELPAVLGRNHAATVVSVSYTHLDEQGKVIYRETTDANGQIPQIPVTPGTYTFKEVYAPDGYALNEAEMRFTVDADGNATGDTTIRDDYTRFSLRKVDESGKPLSGVMFGLKKADGMLMMTAKTDAKGMATFEKVPSISEMVIWVSGMVSEYNPISVITISHSSSSLPFAGSSPKYTPLHLAPKPSGLRYISLSSQFRDALSPDVSLTSI